MALDVYGNNLPEDPNLPGGGTGTAGFDETYLEAIRQLYRDLLGREPGAGEAEQWAATNDLQKISDGIKASAEYKQRAGTTGTGTTGTGTTTGAYNLNALRQALQSHSAPATADELAKFIAAHPEFATGVTIGGSKKNKLYGPNGEFLADVIRGTDSSSPAWDWDTSTETGAGGGTAVDPSYLQPFDTSFGDYWRQMYGTDYVPGADTFKAPDDFKGVDVATMLADPGYQFRKNEAAGMLQNAAAAKGVLNDSGTLYGLMRQADSMAGQEYQNVWDRNFGKWNADWSHALGAFDAKRSASDSDYSKAWQQYVESKDTHFRNINNPFDILTKAAGVGLGAI